MSPLEGGGGQQFLLTAAAVHLAGLGRRPLKGAQSEVIRAICCSWMHIATQSEVIRAIFFEDSLCCGGPHQANPVHPLLSTRIAGACARNTDRAAGARSDQ